MKKKLVLAIFVLILGVSLRAQSFSQGDKSRKFDCLMAANTQFVGEDANSIYLITRWTSSLFGKYNDKDLQVMAVDRDMKEQRSFVLQDTKDHDLVAVSWEEGKFFVLVESLEDKQLLLYRYVIDAATMKPLRDPERIMAMAQPHQAEAFSWGTWSENHRFFGYIATVVDQKSYVMEQRLFDSQLRPLWTKDYDCNNISQIAVTDEGTIATMGVRREGQSMLFEFHQISDQANIRHEAQYNRFVNPAVVRLIHYSNGIFLMGGIVSSSESSADEKLFDRYFAMAYNTRTEQLTGQERSFSLEEVNVFKNERIAKRQKRLAADALLIQGVQPTSYGGVFAIQRKYYVVSMGDFGNEKYTYHSTGVLAVGVDTMGHIVWHQPIRSGLEGDNYTQSVAIESFVEKDHYYLLQSESRKYPSVYETETVLKPVTAQSGAKAVGCYTINPDGRISKQLFPLNESGMLMPNLEKIGSKRYCTISEDARSSLLTIQF